MKATEWKFGMSSCSTCRLDKETFDGYAANNVELMEVSLGSADTPIDWKKTQKLSQDSGVGLWSLHVPFWPFDQINIATKDKNVREYTIKFLTESYLKPGADIGIKTVVIHPSAEPNEDNEREELLKIGAESLAELAEIAAPLGMTIAAEDLPRTCLGNCSSDIIKLISLNDKLRVCFDTNHVLIEKNVDFVKALGNKIVTLHVSDYDFLNERHWLPYEGKIDWVELVTALEDVGYEGPFMYEIGLKTPNTITRRDLTFADFYENYKACVEKRPYKAFGVPNMEECMANAFFKTPVI